MLEAAYPVRFTQWALRPDSAGAGKHRGGLGGIYEFELMADHAELFLFGERGRTGPPGVAGGGAAAPTRFAHQTDKGWQTPTLGAKLVGADLRHAVLVEANLEGADLSGAQLYLANFTQAHAQGATLRGCTVDTTFFEEADLRDADLSVRIEAALGVRKNAYAPFSGFRVGSALLGDDGRVYTGVNVENSSFGLTICAERSAAVSAVSAGAMQIEAVAVASPGGAAPCGACRQFLYEFGPKMRVVLVDADDPSTSRETVLEMLLPDGFRLRQEP